MKAIKILLTCVLFAVPAAIGQNLPDLGDVSQSEMTALQERRLGESIMLEVRSDPSYSEDTEITDYLNSIGNKLVGASSDSRQEFNFFLMMDSQVNAFALPGGFVGINSGLMLTAQSESELAGVMSHEIGHVVQRHFARMLSAQKDTQLMALAGLALAVNEASRAMRAYLAAGGAGSLPGDGTIAHAGAEAIVEANYGWHPAGAMAITLDYQLVVNPAYNRDRGPAHVLGVRLHWGV